LTLCITLFLNLYKVYDEEGHLLFAQLDRVRRAVMQTHGRRGGKVALIENFNPK